MNLLKLSAAKKQSSSLPAQVQLQHSKFEGLSIFQLDDILFSLLDLCVLSSETGPRCSSPVDSESSCTDGTNPTQNRKWLQNEISYSRFLLLNEIGIC